MREAFVERKTKETDISVKLSLDDEKKEVSIETGIGFFDHMLTALAVHSGVSLYVKVNGDLNVDGHHSVEDTGIVLGQAFAKAIGDKCGIVRYGTAFIPMDEALGFCSLDISGRPFLVFDADFKDSRIGDYDSCLTEEFMRAFAFNAGITLHIRSCYGSNDHHKTEAVFKALAHALKMAIKVDSNEILSTKGAL